MPNRLIHETSPYLLQHAHNPVDWLPYGDEAFAEAQSRDLPILFSIGYSACHWCHVMEHESFENEEIARLMNENFVCVKVDREERPDVDHIYMDAVQMMYGHGGWPLNCFALPDGRPFWGGTYFRPAQWKDILVQVSELYRMRFDDVQKLAEDVTHGIRNQSLFEPAANRHLFSADDHNLIFRKLYSQFDPVNGGFGSAPKFPMPIVMDYLLNHYMAFSNNEALEIVLKTLHKMSGGGIYDQASGGFARYSVDAGWKAPHFEKMLYDNAQLVSLYCDAYKISGDVRFRKIAEETLSFISREMTSPEGVFHSALDADSDGEEGLFYTWTAGEFAEALGPYSKLMAEYFGVGSEGLWENERNILLRPHSDALFAQQHFLSLDELDALVEKVKNDLIKFREKRKHPGLDDKILTSWNALMIRAFTDAGATFGNRAYLETAEKAANFLLENLKMPGGGLYRSWKNNKASIHGFLDDYAFMAEALMRLYEVSLNEHWLTESIKITDYILDHFRDKSSGLFFFTDENSKTIARKIETNDGVIPSSNSVMARHLHNLGAFTGDRKYSEAVPEMMALLVSQAQDYPSAFANWCTLGLELSVPKCIIAVAGAEAGEFVEELGKHYLPNTIIAGSNDQTELSYFRNKFIAGKTLIYICFGETCLAPVESVSEALRLIREHQSSENSFTSLR
jgi:uncharacterized protein